MEIVNEKQPLSEIQPFEGIAWELFYQFEFEIARFIKEGQCDAKRKNELLKDIENFRRRLNDLEAATIEDYIGLTD